ncbi:hypothetical protein C3L33_07206, partial [Rhododendron williamsianum]
MATAVGGSIAISRFPSSSYFSRKANSCSSTLLTVFAKPDTPGLMFDISGFLQTVGKSVAFHPTVAFSALQESSTPTVAAETKETKEKETKEVKTADEAVPSKPKRPAKVPAKPLPELMEEDVIPSLRAVLEAQDDISGLELSFGDNRLEGFFEKKGIPFSFWAFFPDGDLIGPKGFSLSSYGSGVSTVEPFLILEKKITAKHVVFWVEKRLAAQGIIPVWKE